MDEVGRGTTPEDGVAVGYACLHYLYHTNRCRTLFATHFHALADMTRALPLLGCYCTDIAEGDAGSFTFVHRLRKGVNRASHALKVARLAGSCFTPCVDKSTCLLADPFLRTARRRLKCCGGRSIWEEQYLTFMALFTKGPPHGML